MDILDFDVGELVREKKMSFDAHEEKIRKILAGDTKFTIPRNQRKYVWEEKQWKELLGDILYIKNRQIMEPKKEINHFLGSFVLQESGSIFEIIDGQQRITTLLLILASLCVVFNELESDEEHGKTKQNLVGNIGLRSQYVRMENQTLGNIAVIIEQASEYRDALKSKAIFDNALLDRTIDGNKRVISCFYFYYNYWKDNLDDVEELVKIREIILDMKVIHIASEDELDCYDIFEILNARGVDLEESELLKNYIFKYAQPKYSVDRAKEIWSKIENNMDFCNGNMEQFLAHFTTYRYYKPSKDESVFRIIKQNTNKEQVNTLLDDLLSASQRYIYFYEPQRVSDKVLQKCFEYFKLVNHRQFRPLFMAILECGDNKYITEKQRNNICVFLKNFSFAFTFVMKNNSNLIDNIIHNLAKDVYNQHSVESLNEIKRKLESYYPQYTDFERSFLNLGFSNKNAKFSKFNSRKRVFYILQEIEEYKQETDELVCNVEECNIEHIMNDSSINDNTSKIGNLLLLSERINSNMGDDNYKDKVDKLKRSKLISVQNFVKHYGEKDDWTDEMIMKRTKSIARLAYDKIWKLD